MTLVSGNLRIFMRIFAGFPWKGVKRQWGNRKRYVFVILGNEANIIIQYYLVPCRLSADSEMHDLE